MELLFAPVPKILKGLTLVTVFDEKTKLTFENAFCSLALATSSEVYESTGDVVQLAWNVASNQNNTKSNSQLHAKCDKWSEQLDIVRATVDKLVNPWSVYASCVVQAVTLKDEKLYTKQVNMIRLF